jgi:hypothetical protein
MRIWALIIGVLSFAVSGTAQAQTYWHSDGRGHSIQAGNTVFNYRNPGYGNSSTHIQAGNTQFHNYSNGTQGTTMYMPQGRYDNFSNPQQGWYGNGYTPYQNQYSNPYGGYGSGYRRYPY